MEILDQAATVRGQTRLAHLVPRPVAGRRIRAVRCRSRHVDGSSAARQRKGGRGEAKERASLQVREVQEVS